MLNTNSLRLDMLLLHRTRKIINELLSSFGVAVVRAEKKPWFRWGAVPTQVGRYSIQVPVINPISRHYARLPNLMSQLGRLTSLVKMKYPHLTAIDIGANVGDTACIIKTAVDIPLLCIEGDNYSFSFLEKNIRQFQNTTAHKLFLGEKTEAITVTFEKNGWNTTIKPDKAGATQKIEVVSLDDFLATQPKVENFKLLKIDTEGFDCAIIRGGGKFIQQVRPVITFEYNRENMDAIGENGLETFSMLAGFGYSHAAFHDANGRFLFSIKTADHSFIRDLHEYADGPNGSIYYYDITVFSEADSDIASMFVEQERSFRRQGKQVSNQAGSTTKIE